MKSAIAAVAFALAPVSAAAQWVDAGQILEACQEQQGFLAGYLAGTLNYGEAIQTLDEQVGRSIEPTICVPKDVTIREVGQKFCAYIEAHPERQSWPMGLLSHSALSHSFPCQ